MATAQNRIEFNRAQDVAPAEWRKIALLGGIALAVYANTLPFGFVYDDFLWIVDNTAIRSLRNAWHFFSSGHVDNRVYRPLPLVWFALDYALAGLHAWFYHAENILLHAAVTVLVYLVVRPVAPRSAWLAAAWFAVLPAHTEVVANITSRSELIGTALGLLALLLWRRPVLAAALLLPALLSKETAVAVIPLAALLGLARRPSVFGSGVGKRQLVRLAIELVPMAVAAALYLVLRRAAHCCDVFPFNFNYQLDNALWTAGLATRLRTGLMILGQNLALCFVPYHLSADYSYPQIVPVTGWVEPRFLLWSGLLAAGVAAAFAVRRRYPNIALGMAWFLIAVFPVSNIVMPIGTIRAERLLYLPSAGTCLIGAELLAMLLTTRRRWALVLMVSLLAVQGAWAARRNLVWRSMDTLVPSLVADAPRSARAHFNLAILRARAGNCAAAIPSFQRALELYPGFHPARDKLANCYLDLGNLAAAEREYRRLFYQDTGNREAAQALSDVCAKRGEPACVATTMRDLIHANPQVAQNPAAWAALANTLVSIQQLDEAEAAYHKAISLGAGPLAHFNLAGLLVRQGRLAEALPEYQAAERMGMDREELYLDFAAALKQAGDAAAARRTAERGLARYPNSDGLRRLAGSPRPQAR